MRCPVCTNVDLLMAERQGVEIDYCPNCRGIWLDRGELDKVIEREQGMMARQENEPSRHVPPQPQYVQSRDQQYRPAQQRGYEEHREHYDDHRGHGYGHGQGRGQGHGKHRKKSFLGELFDFD